jgi:hypothetical protein
VCLEAGENGFQTQNNNRNPTAKQVRTREKLHREANKVANTSFSAACKAHVDFMAMMPGINPWPTARANLSATCGAVRS